MPKAAVGKTFTRSKRKYKSARAAWSNVGQRTGVHPNKYKLKKMHSRTHYRWKVLAKR